MWLMGCGLPCLVIVALIVMRTQGWIIQKSASVEMPILVVTLAAVLLGLPTMILTSRSIADPVREVVDAMAQVEQGRIDTFVRNRPSAKRIQPDGDWDRRTRPTARLVRPPCRGRCGPART
jgi:hypothetical protein